MLDQSGTSTAATLVEAVGLRVIVTVPARLRKWTGSSEHKRRPAHLRRQSVSTASVFFAIQGAVELRAKKIHPHAILTRHGAV